MLKHSFRIQLIVLLSSIIFLAGCASRKSSSSWFKQGQWYNGLNLMPYSDINKVEFETQYKKNKARWDKAFAYLK